ncbi:MAG TPA: glycosyltransferase [Pilimelia sp.]|nr:glycosyltransferase [Pilimelia sp.]
MSLGRTAGRPPLLSVIVPVHRVEPYLRQCLDSVLAEAGSDVEVVAVDDASPDGCPAILDDYARRDRRVRVVHLTTNVGLGEARNAGLDRAAGRHLWFVDGDDWLPSGTMPSVLAALRRHDPDVLLVDHEKVYEADGRREPDPSGALLRDVPGTVRLAERPELLDVQHAAWNRLVRADLMRAMGLRFYPGWYEDCAFSHPVLVAAGRIAALDRVCYSYRQRTSGSITRTVSTRHAEVFDQYERLFSWLDRLGPDADPFRPRLFRIMVNHCLVILGNEARLPAAARRGFFRRLAELYGRQMPPGGYPMPAGVAGIKHRMVRDDAYLAYAMLRLAYRALARLRAAGRAGATVPLPAGATSGAAGAATRPAAAPAEPSAAPVSVRGR